VTTFTLDVDPDAVDRAAQQVEGLRDDLETHRAGVVAAPDRMAQGWTGGAATSVRAEVTALGGHLQTFPAHLTTASTALRDLATAYREALDVTLPALQQRWDAAEQAYTDAVASSADRRAEDVAAIPADAGAQRRMWQDEAQQAHASRVSTAAGARTGTQAAVTGDYEDLVEDLRQATRTASTALAGAVVVPVGDETVSTYLATGQTSLGTLPPAELADLSLAQQHQVAEDLESASSRVEQDIAAGELDEAALDELDALLAFTGGRVLLADAARDAREQVTGAMADVARRAGDPTTEYEQSSADVLLLGDLLRRYGQDDDMTTPFLTDLGGAGTLDLTRASDRLHGDDPADNPYLATAAALRVALMTSSRDPAFPADSFATDLVDRAADASGEMHSGSPGVALAYLLAGPSAEEGEQDAGYGSFFLSGAIEQIVAREQAFAADAGGGDGRGLWYQGHAGQFSQLAATFEGYPDRFGTSDGAANDYALAPDPLVFAVRHLATDSLAGRDVLQGGTGAYLFGERDWGVDGFRAITAAGEHAATDAVPGTVGWDGALHVASSMVNGLGGRDEHDLAAFTETSAAAVARTLSAHMASVQWAISAEGDNAPEDPVLTAASLAFGGQDNPYEVAYFGSTAMDRLLAATVAHEDGVTALRTGLNAYQGVLVDETVARLEEGVDGDPATFLSDRMYEAGELHAELGSIVADHAVATGRERDEVIGFWVDAAGFGVSQGGDALGAVPHPAAKAVSLGVSAFADPAAEAVKEAWADNSSEAVEAAEDTAQSTADRLSYEYAQALHAAGIAPVTLAPQTAYGPDGSLLDWGDLSAADQQQMNGILTAVSGRDGIHADVVSTADAFRDSRLPFYAAEEED